MSVEDVARAHYEGRRRLSDAAAKLARQAWLQVNPSALDASWSTVANHLSVALAGAQLAAATSADTYVDEQLGQQGAPAAADGHVAPGALAGVASDGRPLDSLLLNSIFVAKSAIGAGAPLERAMAAGYANLDMIVRTQVADAGRAADQLAAVARPAVTGYVRLAVGASCSRCVILAGRHYRWNAGFNRHPNCDCIGVPAAGHHADSIMADPKAHFDSLSAAEQDKTFTKAGAAAIREGADMGRVVNARRGMYTAGGKSFTTEATTRAGINRRIRLMPEQIYAEANGDRDEALRLLRAHGYLVRRPVPRFARPAVPRVAAEPHVPAPARVAAPRPPAVVAAPAVSGSALERGIASGIRSRVSLSGGQVADTALVTFNDGSKAIFKTAKAIGPRLSARQQQDAEELGAQVMRAVGLRGPQVVRSGEAELFMEFLDGKAGMALPVDLSTGDRDEFRLLGMADQLIYNTDRHRGNWLVEDNGTLHPIDHGLAFVDFSLKPPLPGEPVITQFRQPGEHFIKRVGDWGEWADNDMSPADMALIRSRVEALRPEFVRLGHGDWFDSMLVRLARIEEHARGTKRRLQ